MPIPKTFSSTKYLWIILCIIPLGLWQVWHQKNKTRSLLFLWLCLYPIPAASTGEPHAIRSLMGAPLFAILSAYGFYAAYEKRHLLKHHLAITSCAILLITLNIGMYLKHYYVTYPQNSAWWWEYGLKETITYTEKQPHLAIQHSHGFYTPFYIHVLFHTQFPPTEYQKLPKVLRENYWANAPLKNKYYNLNVTQLSFAQGDTALLIMRPEDVTMLNQTNYAWQKVHHINDPSGQEIITLMKATAKQ